MTIAKKISIKLKKSIEAVGINIHINNDIASGQIVPHTHIHVIPRLINDGFTQWKGTPYKADEEKEVLQKIKS